MIEIALQVDWPLQDLWSSTLGFVVIMTTIVGAIGAVSRSMTVGATGGYMTFAYYAINVDVWPLRDILYISLVMIFVGLGFKIMRLEAWGE